MVFSAVLTARLVPTPVNSQRWPGGDSVALHTHTMLLKVKGESLAPSSFDAWRLPASQRGPASCAVLPDLSLQRSTHHVMWTSNSALFFTKQIGSHSTD